MHRKDIFEEVAKKYHTTREDVYTEIQKVIDIGYDNPNPTVRARWKQAEPEAYIRDICFWLCLLGQ